MGDFYPWQYKRRKRRYEFEPVPDCPSTKKFVDEFSKRTGISKRDTVIFMQYLKQFIADAIESNAKINFYSFLKLDYVMMKSRRLKDINGRWVEYPAVIRPRFYMPRRLADAGRIILSKEEEEMFRPSNDDE